MKSYLYHRSRGPRFRLPAETIRDQALAVAGLLTEKIGGPSVKPDQPAGLWEQLPVFDDKVYRRSLYTFWKRTVPPPPLTTLRAANFLLSDLAMDSSWLRHARGRVGARCETRCGRTCGVHHRGQRDPQSRQSGDLAMTPIRELDWFAQESPDSTRRGQRLTGMTSKQKTFPGAPSKF